MKKLNGTVRIYAGGFLYNPSTKEILLHKRDNNTTINPDKWAFFGGLSEGDGTPEQAFIREIKEELSIVVTASELIPLRNYYNEERKTQRCIFFVNSKLNKSQMILGEGADFDWITIDAALRYDLTDKVRNDLIFFLEKMYESK